MRLKSFYCILPLTMLALTTTPLAAQDRTAGSSLSVNRAWSTASIADLRETSKNTFSLLDANSSGSITLDEIDIIDELIEGEESLPAEKLAELRRRSSIISYTFMNVVEEIDHFTVTDTNQDGVLNAAEFEAREAALRTHILQLNLNSFDKDKSGSIELSEFTVHLDNIEEIDTNGDGSINPEELRGITDQRILIDLRVNQRESFGRAVQSATKEEKESRTPDN